MPTGNGSGIPEPNLGQADSDCIVPRSVENRNAASSCGRLLLRALVSIRSVRSLFGSSSTGIVRPYISGTQQTHSFPFADSGPRSDLQILKVGNVGSHHFQVHLDEVILDATRLRRGKDFLPIQGVMTYWHHFLGLRRPALNVHRNEAARVLREILGGVVAAADGRDLELKLHPLR